jgi:hypothetical protein
MNTRAPKIALSVALAFACSFVHAGDAASAAAAAANALTSEDEAAVIRKIQERGPRDVAIEKAVAFMISQQGKDGGFGDKHRNAITGLTVMALMAAGHTPDSPQHGPAIRNALNFVLSQMRNDGYMGHSDNSRMYGHGICTLMLTEAAGMTKDDTLEKRLVEACRRAVQLILKAQAIKKAGAHNGGWRYEPASADSDLSLTGWQTMSLRSAKNIGIEVPSTAIQAAVNYIRAMSKEGEFSYDGGGPTPNLRGIGLLALPVCGVYNAPELAKATAQMFKDPPKWQGPWFYYRTYYAAVGMYQMGDDAWNRFYPILDDVLIKQQAQNGSWPEPPGNNELDQGGPVYATAMATLALAVHYHLLPIYQR